MRSSVRRALPSPIRWRVASLASFIWLGWWGLFVVLTAVTLVSLFLGFAHRATYRTKVRDPLARLLAEVAVSPIVVAALIEADKKRLGEIAHFAGDIVGDVGLHCLYWTRRLGDLEAEPLA